MVISSEATTVSDNGADNGLTSINQVQPGVIGRECKKGRGSVNVNQNGGPSVGRKGQLAFELGN